MEAMLKQIAEREHPTREFVDSHHYMPRVHEVRSPCQWLDHCQNGKCPAFIRHNGNFYCAKKRAPI
ncbi:MAG: hypothetical protein ACQCN4_06470 [Candidatus Bathyarchaeia archaeon]